MLNMLLLSGLDGTGKLFEPFIAKKPTSLTVNFFIYDLNSNDNQSIDYQVTCIAEQVKNKFGSAKVIVVAESYSGLLGFELIKESTLNISTIFFVASFLKRPLQIARFTTLLEPKLTGYIHNKLLSYALFLHYGNNDLLALFRKAMNDLTVSNNKRNMFKARCKNIAQAKYNYVRDLNADCIYLQATHDLVVHKNQTKFFEHSFKSFQCVKPEGSHFLLQTNPDGCWQVIQNHLNAKHDF